MEEIEDASFFNFAKLFFKQEVGETKMVSLIITGIKLSLLGNI